MKDRERTRSSCLERKKTKRCTQSRIDCEHMKLGEETLLSIFSSDSTELSKCNIRKLCISRNIGYNRQKQNCRKYRERGVNSIRMHYKVEELM